MQPIFSLCYTSVRELIIPEVLQAWVDAASGQHAIEIIICADKNRLDCVTAARDKLNAMGELAAKKGVVSAKVIIQEEEPFNSTRGWNKAVEHSTGKVIVCVADDFKPCQDWDTQMFNLRPGWIDEDWVVHTEDGYVHDLCVLSILTKVRYDRFGYVFYPAYPSLFSDTEFTEVAYREGRVINAKHILIEHMHPDCGKRLRDSFDYQHASQDRWRMGEMLFNFRKNRGFPIDAGPKAVPTTPGPQKPKGGDWSLPKVGQYPDFAVYMQANRDDLCLNEVCQRLFDEGLRNFFFCIPDEYWSGKPTLETDIKQVLLAARKLRDQGANAETKVFKVGTFRFPGDSRITIETRVRNDSLAWVRQNGFNHICVVDSDELWPKGSVAVLTDVIKTSSPLAISLPMIPVVGFPGYPVNNAQDRVISYVGEGCIFRDCRTPIGPVMYENRITVYHFTSVRRTMEETIEKHRQSGHFDDPDYDFAGFIKDTLPSVKPGMRNIHMFKRYQIWPEIRAWKPEDLAHIPRPIWQYLGGVAIEEQRPPKPATA